MGVLNLLMGLLFLAALGYGVYLLWDSWRSSSPSETTTDDVVVPGGLGGSSTMMSEMNPVVVGVLGLFGGILLFFGLGKLEPYLVRAFRRNRNEGVIVQTDFAEVPPELRLQKVPVKRNSVGSEVEGMFALVPFVESDEEPTKTFKLEKKDRSFYSGALGEVNRSGIMDVLDFMHDIKPYEKGELREIIENLGKRMEMTEKQYRNLLLVLEEGRYRDLKEAIEKKWNKTPYNERDDEG